MNIQQSDYEFFLDQNDKYLRRAKVVSALTFCFCWLCIPAAVICPCYMAKSDVEFLIGILLMCMLPFFGYTINLINTQRYKRNIVGKMMDICMKNADVRFSPKETMNIDLLKKNLFFGISYEWAEGEDLFNGVLYGRKFWFCNVSLWKEREIYLRGFRYKIVKRGLAFCADLPLKSMVKWEDVNLLITTGNTKPALVRHKLWLKQINVSELSEMHGGFVPGLEVYGLGTYEEKRLLNRHVQQLLAYVAESFDSLVDKKEKYEDLGVAIVICDNRMLMFVAGKGKLFDVDVCWWKLEKKVNRDFKYLFFVAEVMKRFDVFDTIEKYIDPIPMEESVAVAEQESLSSESPVAERPTKTYEPSKLTNLDGTLNIDGKSLMQQRIEAENEDLFTQKSRKTLFKYLLVVLAIIGLSIVAFNYVFLGGKGDVAMGDVTAVDDQTGGDREYYFRFNQGTLKTISVIYAIVPDSMEAHGIVYCREGFAHSDSRYEDYDFSFLFGYVHCEYVDRKAEKKFGGRYRNVYEGEMCECQRNGYGIFRTWDDMVEEGLWVDDRQGYTITYKGDDRLYYYDNSADNPEIDPDSVRTYTFRVKPSGAIFYNKELLTKDSPSYETIQNIKTKIDRYIVDSRKATRQKREKLKALLKKYQRPAAK